MKVKQVISLVIGALTTGLMKIIGVPTQDLKILLLLMVIDLIVGFTVSAVWHKSSKTKSGKVSSKVMFKGIVKKILTLVLVVVAYQIDILLGYNFIKHVAIIAFIVQEIISIIENITITGIKAPGIITKALDVLERSVKDEFSDSDKSL